MSTATIPAALTVGEIARRTGHPIFRVQYVIRSRGFQPSMRAGALRIFSEDDADAIAAELDRIDQDRSGDDA